MTKMTYVDALSLAIATVSDADAVERLTALRASIEKRNARKSSSSKPNAKSAANDAIRGEIRDFIASVNEPQTIAAICAGVPSCAGKSTHEMTGLLTKIVKAGDIVRTKVGKLTAYAIAGEDTSSDEDDDTDC